MEPLLYLELSAWAAGSVASIFVATHAVARTRFNEELSYALRNFDFERWSKSWQDKFATLIDIVFGKKPLSFSFFFRSCVASFTAVFLLFIVFLIIAGIGPRTYIASWPPGRLIPGLAFLILGNFVPDYLSLLETRFLVRRMDGSSTLLRVALFLMVDFVATIIVFGLVNPPISFMRFVSVGIADVDKLIGIYVQKPNLILGWLFSPEVDVRRTTKFEDAILFYSTLFTSFWLWLLGSSILVLRFMERFGGPVWRWLRDVMLDIDQAPILALGWMFSTLVLFAFLIAAPFVLSQ